MELRFIHNGTQLDVQAAPDGSRDYPDDIMRATFVDTYQDLLFSIYCPDLISRERTPQEGDYLQITYFRGADTYTFQGRVSHIAMGYGQKLLFANAVTPIEKSNRRKSLRIPISLPAVVRRPDQPANQAHRCTTYDISANGLCLVSNQKLDLTHGSDFTIEIELPTYIEPFVLPVKHVRTGSSRQQRQYKYNHAFIFDGDNVAIKIADLTIALFKLRLESRL